MKIRLTADHMEERLSNLCKVYTSNIPLVLYSLVLLASVRKHLSFMFSFIRLHLLWTFVDAISYVDMAVPFVCIKLAEHV